MAVLYLGSKCRKEYAVPNIHSANLVYLCFQHFEFFCSMKKINCPKCQSAECHKSGIVKGKQRYKCKNCLYNFTVFKNGKRIDSFFVIKALQLHLEGISYREIERIIGISHVTVMNWVKKYLIKSPDKPNYQPTYKVLAHQELQEMISHKNFLKKKGVMITEIGDKYLVIKWTQIRKQSFD
jgi:transposase-like protein